MINNNTRKHVTWDFPVTTTPAVQAKLESAYKTLLEGTGAGAEMRGWMNWPEEYLNSDEYARLRETADHISSLNDAVVVIGIGGSYLTTEAVLNCFYGKYYNRYVATAVYFAGNDLSPDLLDDLCEILHDTPTWSIVYVSKSGGTIEPALAFHTLWEMLVKKYGEEIANQHVYAVTDAKSGTLKNMADEHGWESFIIPDDIGGRYSAFTPCGLLPLAIAGLETDDLLDGAIEAARDFDLLSFAAEYAKWRYSQYVVDGRFVEFYATNTSDLAFFAEWLKQLFGESEGKDGNGILPTSGVFPRDLHSLGQFLQEGTRGIIFETFIIKEFHAFVEIPESNLNDNLDKFQGKTFSQASAAAMDGAFKAHTADGNPCGVIHFGANTEALGYLMQSMFYACALSAYMLGVNPFNQPGVEAHKQNMKTSPEWDK